MNLQSIKYLVALAKYSHFGKAARACFVSQPTLSMQVKKLEDRLGVLLLERTNKSVKLTEIGVQMAEHARSILQEIDSMCEKAQTAKDPYSGQIKIGLVSTVAPYILPLLIPKLTEIFPKLTFHLVEAQTKFLVEELARGTLDTAILTLPVLESQFISFAFFEEEFLLAVPAHHVWAKRKTVQTCELVDENLLLLDDGHCLREQALAVCHQMRAKEMEDFRATSLETLRYMIAAGVGMTLMPKLAIRKGDGIVYLPFSDAKPSRSLGLVWRKSTGRAQLLNELANHITTILRGYG